jgi:hypothetical protein
MTNLHFILQLRARDTPLRRCSLFSDEDAAARVPGHECFTRAAAHREPREIPIGRPTRGG